MTIRTLAVFAAVLFPLATACGGAMPNPASPSDARAFPPIDQDDAAIGDSDALVTLVEFGDYEGAKTVAFEPNLRELRSGYTKAQLRFVYKDEVMAIHRNGLAAAEAAIGVRSLAGNDAFWRFHTYALDHASELRTDALSTWAVAAGVRDRDAFQSGLEYHAWRPTIDREGQEAKAVGFIPPMLLVNGVVCWGSSSLEELRSVIGGQMSKANAALDSGISPGDLYFSLSNANHRARAHCERSVPPATDRLITL